MAHMLFTLYFHARIYKIGENVGQGLLYRTPEHAAAAWFQVPSECPNFGACKHCACTNDNKDENGIVAVAPNEVVEHIEFDLGLENAENNEDVDVTNEEDEIEGTMQELSRWLHEAEAIEDVDVHVDEHEGTEHDVEVLIENVDPPLDVDPLDAISEVIPLEDDPQSVDQAVRVPSPEPVDSSSGTASPVVDVASSSNAAPIAVASMADRLQRRPNAVHSQKRNRPPQCLKRSTHVDNQAAFVALTGDTLTPGRFTDEERELWVELYHSLRKRRNVFQAMHPRWMERTNEEGIHARTMDQLRKFKPTAQRCGLIGKDDEQVDTVEDKQDATQPATTATPSQTPPTTSASSSPSTSSTLSNPSPPYPAIASAAMNVHGPQPTFTASPASVRPPPMAPHVAPSLSWFSSFGQVPPMLNVNDMVAQRLR